MAPESHSAQFGLEPRSKPTQNAGSGPGSGIEGTSGHAGFKNSVSSNKSDGMSGTEGEVGGLAQGDTSSTRPGAGSTTLEPSQGTNDSGDSGKESLKDKLNPFKP